MLEARANASLGVASVVFTVNGQALPAVTGPSVLEDVQRRPGGGDADPDDRRQRAGQQRNARSPAINGRSTSSSG